MPSHRRETRSAASGPAPASPGPRGDVADPVVRAYLLGTALLCGAFVMVVEVMGSRVIGPFFGVSLFVWTALITVTLVSLAAGYAVGGMISQRRGTPDFLFGVVFLAGVFLLAVPLLREPVLRASVPLGLRAGALAASAALFGPALFLLGAIGPLLVRIAARDLATVGRTAGVLSAVSTLGSFAGTVLTGFVLIAWLGVERIFQIVGIALVVLSVVWFAGVRRRFVALLALAAVALAAAGDRSLARKVLPNGTLLEERFRKDGFYGSLRVVDYSAGSLRVRELVLDGQIQGGMDVASGLSVYKYPYYLQFLPWAARPGGRTCLVVGLGAGLIPRWYEARGVRTDVVEINPDVVDAARRWFGFTVSGDVIVDDARHFLARSTKRYDYIVLDAFSGDTTPAHLLSREALASVADRLEVGGVVALNLLGRDDGRDAITAAVVRTLREQFDTVALHRPPRGHGEVTNLALLASRSSRIQLDRNAVAGFPVHPLVQLGAEEMWPEHAPPPDGVLLTDDHNPVDLLDVPFKEAWRRAMLTSTDWDVLL